MVLMVLKEVKFVAIFDQIKQYLFVGSVEEAKRQYPNWFLIRQVGLTWVNGRFVPMLSVLCSSLRDKMPEALYGKRVFTWVSEN